MSSLGDGTLPLPSDLHLDHLTASVQCRWPTGDTIEGLLLDLVEDGFTGDVPALVRAVVAELEPEPERRVHLDFHLGPDCAPILGADIRVSATGWDLGALVDIFLEHAKAARHKLDGSHFLNRQGRIDQAKRGLHLFSRRLRNEDPCVTEIPSAQPVGPAWVAWTVDLKFRPEALGKGEHPPTIRVRALDPWGLVRHLEWLNPTI